MDATRKEPPCYEEMNAILRGLHENEGVVGVRLFTPSRTDASSECVAESFCSLMKAARNAPELDRVGF